METINDIPQEIMDKCTKIDVTVGIITKMASDVYAYKFAIASNMSWPEPKVNSLITNKDHKTELRVVPYEVFIRGSIGGLIDVIRDLQEWRAESINNSCNIQVISAIDKGEDCIDTYNRNIEYIDRCWKPGSAYINSQQDMETSDDSRG